MVQRGDCMAKDKYMITVYINKLLKGGSANYSESSFQVTFKTTESTADEVLKAISAILCELQIDSKV